MSKPKNKGKGHKQPPVRYGKKDKTKASNTVSTNSPANRKAPMNEADTAREKSVVITQPKESNAPLDFTQPITLQFSAVDTLFFRETRPMESQGELQSVFPPSVRTLAGVVRSWIGNCWMSKEGDPVDWKKFSEQEDHPLREIIGFGNDLGALKFQGAWLKLNDQRLYPAPLNLMKTKKDELFFLKLDQPIECDLGKQVRLATFPSDEERYKGGKALENTWLTAADLSKVLLGEKPDPDSLVKADKLFERESRLGIARDNQRRGVIEGLLYQTQHVRPEAELLIELDVVAGLPKMPSQTVVRLGGEGRPAQVKLVQQTPQLLTTIEASAIKNGKFALYLLTPLPIEPNEILPDFIKQECPEQTVWMGTLKGINLKLHSAVTGKLLREGGWDMAKHAPRTVTNFIPAGSVFYLELQDSSTAKQAIEALHDKQVGTLTELGFGHVAVGVWNDEAKD